MTASSLDVRHQHPVRIISSIEENSTVRTSRDESRPEWRTLVQDLMCGGHDESLLGPNIGPGPYVRACPPKQGFGRERHRPW